MMHNYGGGMMSILWIIILVMIIVGALSIFRTGSRSGGTVYNDLIDEERGEKRAIEIAKERLAKGEITHEEYDEIIRKVKEP